MAITPNSARAYTGLNATAQPTSDGVDGLFTIGQSSTMATLASATHAVVLGVEVDASYTVSLAATTLVPTLSGAGQAQVETTQAVGTITANGFATVTVTGDDITGSPLAISVAVANTDNASTWAGKVRTALNATTAITSLYTVGGSTDTITLTRTVARYNDATLNIALANGTCTGITEDATSTSTTAGINPAKCWRISGTTYAGEDFEGVDIPTIGNYYGIQIRNTAGADGTLISCGADWADFVGPLETLQKSVTTGYIQTLGSNPLVFTGDGVGYSRVIVTLLMSA